MYPGFGPSMFGRPEKDVMMKDVSFVLVKFTHHLLENAYKFH